MRARGQERGRQPTDQERQIGRLDIHVFSQLAHRTIANRNRKRALAGRSPEMSVGLFDDLPTRRPERDRPPGRIPQIVKDGRARLITSNTDKIGFGQTRDVGLGSECADCVRKCGRRRQPGGRLAIPARQPANNVWRLQIMALLMSVDGHRHRVSPVGSAERPGTRGDLQQFLSCACSFCVTTRCG
jgi:hypothetical protein